MKRRMLLVVLSTLVFTCAQDSKLQRHASYVYVTNPYCRSLSNQTVSSRVAGLAMAREMRQIAQWLYVRTSGGVTADRSEIVAPRLGQTCLNIDQPGVDKNTLSAVS